MTLWQGFDYHEQIKADSYSFYQSMVYQMVDKTQSWPHQHKNQKKPFCYLDFSITNMRKADVRNVYMCKI